MKILLVLEREREAQLLSAALEALGHRTIINSTVNESLKLLHHWCPDLLVTDAQLRRDQPDSGLRLAELCQMATERRQQCCVTRVLILSSVADWDRMRRAQRTGAHVIVKGANFDAVVRYVEVASDTLTTDRILGPILFGVHEFQGRLPDQLCKRCCWRHAHISYLTSQTEIDLTPCCTAILNALFCLRRGQSATEIAWTVNNLAFLRSILRGRLLKESSIKMEISRIRHGITKALERIGAPYTGHHFLPAVPHSVERYRLAGNWAVQHYPMRVIGTENAPCRGLRSEGR